ncbi:hypothetical protein [Nesterenkonia alkaliphila]|uniref:Uncharacterized protein n=1 Tax=Nesterenkonia alkaliphila TaxID=1463631 RepID=A0A7K1UM65_9MICC|nr:hypothetical protein [Nesterenkonia alkaliphila]MVT27141.1 hypothetical protein [Nesterenkonia alkaliphila]GFZ91244.1 hypothetical protein GCM10011359_20810 [Nesterenkonia alkaliphila]
MGREGAPPQLGAEPEDTPAEQRLGHWAQYRVAVTSSPECTPASFSSGMVIVGGAEDRPIGLTENITVSHPLAADAADPVYYCLEFSLPEDTPLQAQGTAVSPEWEFLVVCLVNS